MRYFLFEKEDFNGLLKVIGIQMIFSYKGKITNQLVKYLDDVNTYLF